MGLGMILRVEHATLEILFPAAEETRCYAKESAPLRRVIFKVGEKILTHDGKEYEVLTAVEHEGLVVYQTTDGVEIPEAQLSEMMGFSKPMDRLFAARVDENSTFSLRAEALLRHHQIRKSPLRGFLGGRTDHLVHQISVVSEVAKRLHPRVLLADEVGLGKTIEACMIMHRLYLTGRAERVLIVLPEPLVNQWFVELLRRFNLLFSLFDEERCEAIELNDPEANPFLDSQLVIVSLDFLAENGHRAEQCRESGWDLLIVDEVHHLVWEPGDASREYSLVEALAHGVPSVLLLSATPQQLGVEGHFARLRLLDPDRFCDLDAFIRESDGYGEVAALVQQLEAGAVQGVVSRLAGFPESTLMLARKLEAGDESVRPALIGELLDSFGTGRVMFRNTRQNLSGFPERMPHLIPIQGDGSGEEKIDWLVGLLAELGEEKVLLICAGQEDVEMISAGLLERVQVNVAHFHEGLSLNQRDRNAVYFAENEGARILLCSEIGSEGRNFQFCHHLVLFDMPSDPELLEQRIGRLDRIGQRETIHIYAPYFQASDEEVWARWYHDGLGAMQANVHGATEIFKACEESLDDLMAGFEEDQLLTCIEQTKVKKALVGERLAQGYDRLLELNSYRPDEAGAIIRQLRVVDEDKKFEEFMLVIMEHFGLAVEDLSDRTYFLKPQNLSTDAFPNMPEEGMSVSFDRTKTLSREDIQFISWDHPITRASFDLLLGSEVGNAAFGVWYAPGEKRVFLECYFVVEVLAPGWLHVDRFLPGTPIRVAVDHAGSDLSQDRGLMEARLQKGSLRKLLAKPVVKQQLLPKMFEQAEELAKAAMKKSVAAAKREMNKQLNDEIQRLEHLAERNPMIGENDITALKQYRDKLTEAMTSARLRPDAVRLIWKEQG